MVDYPRRNDPFRLFGVTNSGPGGRGHHPRTMDALKTFGAVAEFSRLTNCVSIIALLLTCNLATYSATPVSMTVSLRDMYGDAGLNDADYTGSAFLSETLVVVAVNVRDRNNTRSNVDVPRVDGRDR